MPKACSTPTGPLPWPLRPVNPGLTHRITLVDCEGSRFYALRHPNAAFVNHLVASRLLEGEIRSLRNRDHHILRDAAQEQSVIGTADALHRILVDDFGLAVTQAQSDRLFGQLE